MSVGVCENIPPLRSYISSRRIVPHVFAILAQVIITEMLAAVTHGCHKVPGGPASCQMCIYNLLTFPWLPLIGLITSLSVFGAKQETGGVDWSRRVCGSFWFIKSDPTFEQKLVWKLHVLIYLIQVYHVFSHLRLKYITLLISVYYIRGVIILFLITSIYCRLRSEEWFDGKYCKILHAKGLKWPAPPSVNPVVMCSYPT